MAEVNYKLDAFMKLWKGLATDVDDIYDKVITLYSGIPPRVYKIMS